MLMALFVTACGGVAEPGAAATPEHCGWALQGVGFTGPDWDHADIGASCGYLPEGVSPCVMEPVRRWENDGAPIIGWQRSPTAVCSPVLTLRGPR